MRHVVQLCPHLSLILPLVVAAVLLMASHLGRLFNLPRWDWETVRKLYPMIALNVLGLVVNNLCLQYVDASFYQVARGLDLPILNGTGIKRSLGLRRY